MESSKTLRLPSFIGYLIVATAIVGFFVGLQSPMNPLEKLGKSQADRQASSGMASHSESPLASAAIASNDEANHGFVIKAASYSEMAAVMASRRQPSSLSSIARSSNQADPFAVDPLILQLTSHPATAEVTISINEKQAALAQRQRNRAYNGAPPTVTHPIDQMTTEACFACHSHGAKVENFRIPRMSHPFFANCTQCHVGAGSQVFPSEVFKETRFVGLSAPEGGPRAFPGAPPQIPHSTWMRNDCVSCHGPTSLRGIQTSHPWRQNCQQCHAPSSKLDQIQPVDSPQFMSEPSVIRMNDRIND